jgi:transcriptional regulator with XRE-family HTH domain
MMDPEKDKNMSTEHERVPAKATGRRFDSVSALMSGEGTPEEVQAAVKELTAATKIVLQLAKLRHACGITQEQMADHLGVSQSAISKLESGRDEELTLGEVRGYARVTGNRIGMVFGKPLTHVEAVKAHAEGIRHHLHALAKLANQDNEMEKEIQAFFGEAFFNILTILSKCNDALPNAAGEFSMEIIKQGHTLTCVTPRTISAGRTSGKPVVVA